MLTKDILSFFSVKHTPSAMSLDVIARLLWAPQSLQPANTKRELDNKFRIPFYLAMAAFAVHLMWIIPADEIIRIPENDLLELYVNKILGLVLGGLLIWMLVGFEILIFGIAGYRGVLPAIRGSMISFIFLPCIGIPIHAWFPNGVSQSGYAWIVWVLIASFLLWHDVWLGILLGQGYYKECKHTYSKALRLSSGVSIFLIEIIITVVAALFLPLAFRSSYQEFMWDWF
jgi:hypothetical protein